MNSLEEGKKDRDRDEERETNRDRDERMIWETQTGTEKEVKE